MDVRAKLSRKTQETDGRGLGNGVQGQIHPTAVCACVKILSHDAIVSAVDIYRKVTQATLKSH